MEWRKEGWSCSGANMGQRGLGGRLILILSYPSKKIRPWGVILAVLPGPLVVRGAFKWGLLTPCAEGASRISSLVLEYCLALNFTTA